MKPKKSFSIFKWLLVAAGLGTLALIVAIIHALAPGGPAAAEMRKIERQVAEARKRLPAVENTLTTATRTAPRPPTRVAAMRTTQTAPTPAGLTDQERCDWLFRKIVHYFDDDGDYREYPRSIPGSGTFLDLRPEARELAAFYDKGIRVSAEARREFKLPYARMLGQLMELMVKVDAGKRYLTQEELMELDSFSWQVGGKAPKITEAEAGRILDALRFRTIAGCPVWPSPFTRDGYTHANLCLAGVLDPGDRELAALPPLPPAIEKMELQLLAPRNDAGDWDRFLALLIEMEREVATYRGEMTHPAAFFRHDWQRQQPGLARSRKGLKGNLYWAGEFCGSVFDTIVYHRYRVKESHRALEEAQRLLDYATRASGGGPVELDESTLYELRLYNDQIVGRALAAALELRRGKAVPARGSVTAESYCFDLATRQPMLMFRSPAGPGVTRLLLAWPTGQQPGAVAGEETRRRLRSALRRGTQERGRAVSVLLPAGHPGLAAVPELE